MASIELRELRKTYPGGAEAVRGVDLTVSDGELLVLVGPSGCGKSTVLRLVAGLESPTAGRIRVAGRDVTETSPRERDVAMVFQSYALYPHKSVRDNLAFPLRMRAVGAPEIARRVGEVAERLELGDVLDRRPAQLSGGQRQRVALGRALVREPQVFLLDEPLSNLDARLRVETRATLARLHQSLGATMLYVTHDQEEAMTLGDRIAVMRDGRVEQVGPPLDVYERPATIAVADFIGSPRMSWLDGSVVGDGANARVRGADFAILAPARAGLAAGRSVRIGIRPHDLAPAAPEQADLTARVEVLEPTGSALLVHALLPSGEALRVLLPPQTRSAIGESLSLRLPGEKVHLFDPSSGARL